MKMKRSVLLAVLVLGACASVEKGLEGPISPGVTGASQQPLSAGTRLHATMVNSGAGLLNGWRRQARAWVRVEDEFGAPVVGAKVTGEFSGCTRQSKKDPNNQALTEEEITTSRIFATSSHTHKKFSCAKRDRCNVEFTVTNIEKAGYTYAPEENTAEFNSRECK